MNTLGTPLITTLDLNNRNPLRRTLPGMYAALTRNEIGDFPALRPHQRHVWHAFLVQAGALALLKAGLDNPPEDEGRWRSLLLGLAPDDRDGAAWSLVSPPDHPALLQAPVPGGDLSRFKRVDTPDLLDILVTAKNHDLKAARLIAPEPEHWLFALVSLQTQEGFLGAGNYGISRMNGGFASRPGFGIEPAGGPSARFQRDLKRLLALRTDILRDYVSFASQGGLGLVWLLPWDGESSLAMRDLDPFYIEICRRIRLISDESGHIAAVAKGSKAARIEARALKGDTGDPWTPLVADGDGRKALSLDAGGLGYRRLVPLLFPKSSEKDAAKIAPLQAISEDDADGELYILARVLVRGQGKTEGFHERRLPVSKSAHHMMRTKSVDRIAQCAHARVEDVGLFGRKVLYPAIMAVFTGAPGKDERARDDDTAKDRVRRALDSFERRVDLCVFDGLDKELGVLGDCEAADAVRGQWLLDLRDIGRDTLEAAIRSAPDAAMRHWRIRVVARDIFTGCFTKLFRARIPEGIWNPQNASAREPVFLKRKFMALDNIATAEIKTQEPNGYPRNERRDAIWQIAIELAKENFGTGPLASLRRHSPSEVMKQPAFYRLIENLPDEVLRDDASLRWATLIQAIAIGTKPGKGVFAEGVGKALAKAGYSESRFARLLASHGETFRDQIVLLARYMNSKQVRFNWTDPGELVLVESLHEERAGILRFRIARDYYRALGAKQYEQAPE